MVASVADGSRRTGQVIIDLTALAQNYLAVAAGVRPARAGAVVKADAYGLGAVRTSLQLARAGCRDFFVAQLDEGLALKTRLGPDVRVYVLHGPGEGEEAAFRACGLVPVLNTVDQVRRWSALKPASSGRWPVAIQIDTGMHRLGLRPQDMDAAIHALDGGDDVVLVMSHLACADDADHPANPSQCRAFERAVMGRLPHAERSLANSYACGFVPHASNALVRSGLALFGGLESLLARPLQAVVRVRAPVLQLHQVPASHGVGYGLHGAQPFERRIATIGLGYADGWSTCLSQTGAAWFGDVRLPATGAVSMDSFAVDASDIGAAALAEGDFVDLVGPNQDLETVARAAGAIPYEILTRLGSRLQRIYIKDGEFAA